MGAVEPTPSLFVVCLFSHWRVTRRRGYAQHVSNHKQRPHQQKPTQPSEPSRLEYAPPEGHEDRPPFLANNVVVTGSADAVVLTFYHISPNTFSRVFDSKRPLGPHVERHGELAIIRSEPIARVALPFTVAADTILEILSTIVQGVPEIQASLGSVMTRVAEIAQHAEALKGDNAGEAPKEGE